MGSCLGDGPVGLSFFKLVQGFKVECWYFEDLTLKGWHEDALLVFVKAPIIDPDRLEHLIILTVFNLSQIPILIELLQGSLVSAKDGCVALFDP